MWLGRAGKVLMFSHPEKINKKLNVRLYGGGQLSQISFSVVTLPYLSTLLFQTEKYTSWGAFWRNSAQLA